MAARVAMREFLLNATLPFYSREGGPALYLSMNVFVAAAYWAIVGLGGHLPGRS